MSDMRLLAAGTLPTHRRQFAGPGRLLFENLKRKAGPRIPAPEGQKYSGRVFSSTPSSGRLPSSHVSGGP